MPSFRFVLYFDAESKDDARDFGDALEAIAGTITERFPRLRIAPEFGEVQTHQLNEWAKLRRS